MFGWRHARIHSASKRRPRRMAISTPSAMTAEEIVALSRQYTLYEWSAQSAVDPIAVERAEGVYFYSPDGKRYIDFNSQLMSVNIGHGDQRVVRAIAAQAEKLAYANPFMAHEPRARLGPQKRTRPRPPRTQVPFLFLLF